MDGLDMVTGGAMEVGADGHEDDDLRENEEKLRAAANNLVDAESDAIAASGKVAMLVSGGGGVGSSVVEEAKLDREIADTKVSEARSKVEHLEAKVEGSKVESMSRQAR